MTNEQVLEKLKLLSEKTIVYPKYLLHQPNGSFKETHLVAEYREYKGPKMVVAVLKEGV